MQPLQIAINMETEGKRFYEAASQKASDKLGQELYERLAGEEDFHAAKAREISQFLSLRENPLAIEESLDQGQKIDSIFARAREALDTKRDFSSSEIEAIDIAMDMEQKSIKFYEESAKTVQNEFERRFFSALKAEERGHYLSLVDYKQYLTAPADWFAQTEHHSLDGG